MAGQTRKRGGMMDYQGKNDLNHKLALWAGWKQLPPGNKGYHWEQGVKVMSWMPPGETEIWRRQDHFPNFTASLDAIFRWLVPKLNGTVCCQFETHAAAEIFIDRKVRYKSKAETPALALCLAISKLIDATPAVEPAPQPPGGPQA